MKRIAIVLLAAFALVSSIQVWAAQTSASIITTFTTSATSVSRQSLQNRSARIPVSWTTNNRPDNSNLVFEQVLADGSVVNVELPRDNPYVGSNGDGVAAPTDPGATVTTILLRLRLVDLTTQNTLDQRQLTVSIGDATTLPGSIRLFSTSATSVRQAALLNKTARIPVAWAVNNRPERSNLVFEQVLTDGSSVNVELPRSNPYVASAGNGVAAPVPPGGNPAAITLRLRLVNLADGATLDQKEITVPINQAPAESVTIRAFTAGATTVNVAALNNRSARVPVAWAVDNRPEGSNLVFEQVLADNSGVNVELPRSNPLVSSAGNGVVAPVLPGGSTNNVVIRLRVIDLASQNTLAQQSITLAITDTLPSAAISFFTTSATSVDVSALTSLTARIPVSWSVENRPDGSNLVFEQRLDNGSSINVELPRSNPYVASAGNGVAAPTAPTNPSTNSIVLVLRLVNLVDGATITQKEINLPISGVLIEPTPTEIVSPSRAIFIRGQALGNRANVFSKVGDSLTDTPNFLRQMPAGYNLRAFNALQSVTQYFSSAKAYDSNSFGSTSRAARASWSSFSVLDPASADKGICQGGETPLECEYRLVKPSVALIMIGVNDVPAFPPTTYEANLKRIIEISIDKGVIPVVSTLPPRPDYPDRLSAFNQVIVQLTQTYDIPLWDVNKELVKLPNQGLGPDRIHLSVPPGAPAATVDFTSGNLAYGTTMRNLTALQILDYVWRVVISP